MRRRLAQLEGFVAEGDVFGVEWAAAEGRYPALVNEFGWAPPVGFRFGTAPEKVVITDELGDFAPGTAYLRPPSLIAGIHPSPYATADQIENIFVNALADAGLARSSVFCIATADHIRNDRSIRRLGYPIRSFLAPQLNRVLVPNPSVQLQELVNTRSVCEASALLAAGPGAQLVVERMRTPVGTIAIARRRPPVDMIIDVSALSGMAAAPVRRSVQ
jgi:cobalt-precorrin 5A hydrolase / precorrin-3B C17-methyltransferase